MKIDFKGPVGMILGVIFIGVMVYIKFFLPYSVTLADRKAILKKLKELQMEDISRINKVNMDHFKKSGQFFDDSKELANIMGDIKIVKVEGKKAILGDKIKVSFTISGKVPKNDRGIRFFSINRRYRKNNHTLKETILREITEDDYVSSKF